MLFPYECVRRKQTSTWNHAGKSPKTSPPLRFNCSNPRTYLQKAALQPNLFALAFPGTRPKTGHQNDQNGSPTTRTDRLSRALLHGPAHADAVAQQNDHRGGQKPQPGLPVTSRNPDQRGHRLGVFPRWRTRNEHPSRVWSFLIF